ncbi:MAG: hypothetical protein U0414_12160 [Polyangiaceae bacterium]
MRSLLLRLLVGLGVCLSASPALADGGAPLTIAAPAEPPAAPLVTATAPPPPIATAPPVSKAAPPRKQAEPNRRPRRWYGWQVLLVHGLSDAIAVGGLIGMEWDVGGGFIATTLSPIFRGLATGILEAAHDDTAAGVLWGSGSFLLPIIGGAGMSGAIAGDRTRKDSEDVEPVFARSWGAGILLGGSIMTAIEASVAFEDMPSNIGLHLSPTHVSVDVAF